MDGASADVALDVYTRVKQEHLRRVLDHAAYAQSVDRMRKEAQRMQQGTRVWLQRIVDHWMGAEGSVSALASQGAFASQPSAGMHRWGRIG